MLLTDNLYPVTQSASRGQLIYGAILLAIIIGLAMWYWSWAMRVYAKGKPRAGTKAYNLEFSRTRTWVLRRDGYRCRQCGDGGPLDVHHLVPRAAGGSNDPSNLIALCPTCHGLAHRHR
jgi:hypothetical protein